MPAATPAPDGATFPRNARDINAWRTAVMGCADVSPAERLVLARFAGYARLGPELTWAAASTLADDLGVSLRHVERAMATMREVGAAKVVEPARGRRAARWTLVPPSYWTPNRKAVNGYAAGRRCGETTRAGQPCRAWPVDGLRCVQHGGRSTDSGDHLRHGSGSRSTDRMSSVVPTQAETDSSKTVGRSHGVDTVDASTSADAPVERAAHLRAGERRDTEDESVYVLEGLDRRWQGRLLRAFHAAIQERGASDVAHATTSGDTLTARLEYESSDFYRWCELIRRETVCADI